MTIDQLKKRFEDSHFVVVAETWKGDILNYRQCSEINLEKNMSLIRADMMKDKYRGVDDFEVKAVRIKQPAIAPEEAQSEYVKGLNITPRMIRRQKEHKVKGVSPEPLPEPIEV